MADNTQLNPGAFGDNIRTIEETIDSAVVKTEVVLAAAKISTANTSTTALGVGGDFTGEWERNIYQDVLVVIETDKPGTLRIQLSNDGINTSEEHNYTVSGDQTQVHKLVKGGQYVCVRFLNGPVAQGFMRLNTYFGQHHDNVVQIGAEIKDTDDAQLVRAVISDKVLVQTDINDIFARMDAKFSIMILYLDSISPDTFTIQDVNNEEI